MKFAILLALLSLNSIFNTAYATEGEASVSDDITISSISDDIAAYCDEQAQLSGIEAAQEKAKFTKECIDGFAAPSGDAQ